MAQAPEGRDGGGVMAVLGGQGWRGGPRQQQGQGDHPGQKARQTR
jgi:hypothetical protein